MNENFSDEQLPNFQDGDTIILVGKEKLDDYKPELGWKNFFKIFDQNEKSFHLVFDNGEINTPDFLKRSWFGSRILSLSASSLEYIGKNMFNECSNLEKIDLPSVKKSKKMLSRTARI